MNNGNSTSKGPGNPTSDTEQDLLDRAIRLHKEGQLREAESAYREVLQTQPEHPTSLHMLGVLAYQAGKFEDAISLINRARVQAPGDPGLYTNLGSALQACGRLEEAVETFMEAIEINPRLALAHNNLGNALRLQGNPEQAIAAFQQALSIESNYTEAYVNLAAAYQSQGEMEQAARCYQKAVELNPNHESAAHMLAALHGDVTENAPPEHVTRLFDEYAVKFDHHLVDTLGYSMPGLLRSEIDQLQGSNANYQNVIDLGCGTGLAGIAFRSISGQLTGIDLSPRMIDRARERNVYDTLHTGDIITFLQEQKLHWDLFLCADVFPYIGDVQPLFSALRSCARENALFAFSTETHTGSNYILRPTGRFAHAQDYLHSAAADHGFSVRSMRTENLRKHKEQWIRGDLVILQYRGDDRD